MPDVSLTEAASKYGSTLSASSRSVGIEEVNRFVRWYGVDRPPAQMRGHDIELYAEKLGPAGPATSRKAEHVRAFLAFLKKEGIVSASLAPHLRLKKAGKNQVAARSSAAAESVELTAEGIEALKRELESLIAQRPEIREAIRLAMLDKDFRENAPLDAAKDRQGHVEARIREIEAMLRRAVVVEASSNAGRVRVGFKVKVTNLNTAAEREFSIVGPTEANAADGKISSVSPVGKALLDSQVGDEVEFAAPSGTQRFRIEEIIA
jgi:transcription elongation factor GreA